MPIDNQRLLVFDRLEFLIKKGEKEGVFWESDPSPSELIHEIKMLYPHMLPEYRK